MKYETKELIKAIVVMIAIVIISGLGNHYIDGIYQEVQNEQKRDY